MTAIDDWLGLLCYPQIGKRGLEAIGDSLIKDHGTTRFGYDGTLFALYDVINSIAYMVNDDGRTGRRKPVAENFAEITATIDMSQELTVPHFLGRSVHSD